MATAQLPPRLQQWVDGVIKPEEIDRYLDNGKCFIDEAAIWRTLEENRNPDEKRIRDIMDKSLAIQRLDPESVGDNDRLVVPWTVGGDFLVFGRLRAWAGDGWDLGTDRPRHGSRKPAGVGSPAVAG